MESLASSKFIGGGCPAYITSYDKLNQHITDLSNDYKIIESEFSRCKVIGKCGDGKFIGGILIKHKLDVDNSSKNFAYTIVVSDFSVELIKIIDCGGRFCNILGSANDFAEIF